MAAANILRRFWYLLLALFVVPVLLICAAIVTGLMAWGYCVAMAALHGRFDKGVLGK